MSKKAVMIIGTVVVVITAAIMLNVGNSYEVEIVNGDFSHVYSNYQVQLVAGTTYKIEIISDPFFTNDFSLRVFDSAALTHGYEVDAASYSGETFIFTPSQSGWYYIQVGNSGIRDMTVTEGSGSNSATPREIFSYTPYIVLGIEILAIIVIMLKSGSSIKFPTQTQGTTTYINNYQPNLPEQPYANINNPNQASMPSYVSGNAPAANQQTNQMNYGAPVKKIQITKINTTKTGTSNSSSAQRITPIKIDPDQAKPRVVTREVKDIRIFISYAMADSNRLRIGEIAQALESHPFALKVHYWEGWSGFPDGNIVRFMEANITDCDVFIPFCTKASIDSINCQKERDMAYYLNKRTIPIFEDIQYVPPSLLPYRGVDITQKEVSEIVQALSELML